MNILVMKNKDGSFTINGDGHRIDLNREQAEALRDILTIKLKKR